MGNFFFFFFGGRFHKQQNGLNYQAYLWEVFTEKPIELWSVSKSYRVALSIPQNASKSLFKKILNSMTAEGLLS